MARAAKSWILNEAVAWLCGSEAGSVSAHAWGRKCGLTVAGVNGLR